MSKKIAEQYAKEQGFDLVKPWMMWKGYEVYSAGFQRDKNGRLPVVGGPFFVLIKDGRPRMAEPDEVQEIFFLEIPVSRGKKEQ